jgi:mersacidin/lichenicidin family type 2 lantibiotic
LLYVAASRNASAARNGSHSLTQSPNDREETMSGESEKTRAELSNDPAGDVELGDEELETVAGGSTECAGTMGCCNGMTISDPADSCCCTLWPQCDEGEGPTAV